MHCGHAQTSFSPAQEKRAPSLILCSFQLACCGSNCDERHCAKAFLHEKMKLIADIFFVPIVVNVA